MSQATQETPTAPIPLAQKIIDSNPAMAHIVHSAEAAVALTGNQRQQAAYLRRFGWKETMDGWIDPNIGGSRTRQQAVTYQAKQHVEAASSLLNPAPAAIE